MVSNGGSALSDLALVPVCRGTSLESVTHQSIVENVGARFSLDSKGGTAEPEERHARGIGGGLGMYQHREMTRMRVTKRWYGIESRRSGAGLHTRASWTHGDPRGVLLHGSRSFKVHRSPSKASRNSGLR